MCPLQLQPLIMGLAATVIILELEAHKEKYFTVACFWRKHE
jgi:hypothetical protein